MAISLTLFYGSPNAHNGAAASLGSIARATQKLNTIALSQTMRRARNSEHVDVALIDRARHEIDKAAYVLTDWPNPASTHTRGRSRCQGAHLSRWDSACRARAREGFQ